MFTPRLFNHDIPATTALPRQNLKRIDKEAVRFNRLLAVRAGLDHGLTARFSQTLHLGHVSATSSRASGLNTT